MEKKFYLSKKDKMVGGVCGGLGEYFGIDATLVRLAWMLLICYGGVGLIPYLIAWIIAPQNPND